MSGKDVLLRLDETGYLEYFKTGYTLDDKKPIVRGYVRLGVLAKLKLDDRFGRGPWHLLHKADVGSPRCDFRSHRNVLGKGKGSLQIVINTKTGKAYSDLDRFPVYSDVAGSLGHVFLEVVPGWLNGWGEDNA